MAASSSILYVVDASYLLGGLLPDEHQPDVLAMLARHATGEIHLLSTPILPVEFANGLRSAILRGRLTASHAHQILTNFQDVEIDMAPIDIKTAWKLSQRHAMTLYDAAYLTLAQERHATLLTADAALARVTPATS